MSDIVYENFGFSTPFLIGYKELKIPIVDSAGNPAWPEVFPAPRIEFLRRAVGARHFSAQMMLTYMPADKVRLDPNSLQFYSDEFDAHTSKIADWQITGAVAYWDPSMGRASSDGSVCVILYRDDRRQHIFIHDVAYMRVGDEEKFPLQTQCDMVLDFLSRHRLRRIVLETNGLGNGLPEILHNVARERDFNICIGRVTNNKNKESRILDAIEPVLTTGRLHAHERIRQTPLLSEMLAWSPIGGAMHDDGIDAVAGAIMATPIPLRPLGTYTRPISANTNFQI